MKIIILDFDGTIADTRSSIIKTVQMTLQELHLPLANEKRIKELIGLPLKDTFEKAAYINDCEIFKTAITKYREIYNEISLNTVQLFPNVKNTMNQLYTSGYKVAVASSKGCDSLITLLEKFGIMPYISIALGEQDVKHKKPAPDVVLRILEMLKSLPRETLVVGDTIYDIQMGQNAGCRTCGVTYGNHTKYQLLHQGADYVIDDFSEIKSIQFL